MGNEVGVQATDIVVKFTDHDISSDSTVAYLAITSAVFGMLSPMMFGCAGCSAGLGVGSAVASLNSGILMATQTTAAEM